MKTIYREVGEGVRAKRLQLGLTLEDLAELSGLHASYIGQIERDEKKASLKTVAVLAKALGVPVGGLFASNGLKRDAIFTGQLDTILRSHNGTKRKLIIGVLRQLSKGLKGMK